MDAVWMTPWLVVHTGDLMMKYANTARGTTDARRPDDAVMLVRWRTQ